MFQRVWLLAAVVLAAGLVLAKGHLALRWRGRVIYEKLCGHLPYLGWKEVARIVLSRAHNVWLGSGKLKERLTLLAAELLHGRNCEQYQTKLGKFWIAAPGRDCMSIVSWELTVQRDYEHGEVGIRAGDTVIDCGAHIGMFSRYALEQGARQVVAIEPDPVNQACLEANLAPEIASGQVAVVKAGVWERADRLTLFHWEGDESASQSFLFEPAKGTKIEGTPVLPLDDIVAQFKLDRVDFIKMDLEGSERHALEGAQQTLRRFKPRMAICSYHLADDPVVLPALVRKAQPTYRIHAKDVEVTIHGDALNPKVLFFE